MDFSDRTPLYLRVKQALLKRIRAGDLAQNYRLPSEGELTQYFGVSRATIRSALQSLEDDGVIIKRHGIGTFVNEEGLQIRMRIDDPKGFLNLIRLSGRRPSSSKPVAYDSEVDQRTAKLLGLAKGQKCFRFEQLFLGDDEPAVHVAEIIPYTFINKKPDPENIPLSIFEFADQYCRSPIHYFITDIIPVKMPADIKTKMQLTKGEVMLKLEELHYSQDNRPLAVSNIHVRDKMIRFQVIRNRPF